MFSMGDFTVVLIKHHFKGMTFVKETFLKDQILIHASDCRRSGHVKQIYASEKHSNNYFRMADVK